MKTATSEVGEGDSMYGGGDEGGAPRGTKEPSVDEQNEKAGEGTILIPKSALGGKVFKVGEEVVLEITGDHGEEVSAKYATEKPEHQRGESDDNADIDAMDDKAGAVRPPEAMGGM